MYFDNPEDEKQLELEEQEREQDIAAEWLKEQEKEAKRVARSEAKRVAGGHGEVRTLTPEDVGLSSDHVIVDAPRPKSKKRSISQRISDGFYTWLLSGSESKLLKAVEDRAKQRLYSFDKEMDQGRGADGQMLDACDWTQEVLIAVWERMATFEGDSTEFEMLVNTICTNRLHEARRDRNKNRATHVPVSFDVDIDDDEGQYSETRDNPEIVNMIMGVGKGYAFGEYLIPESLEGHERWAAELTMDGLSDKEIAREMGKSEQAVRNIFYRIRKKVAPEREEYHADRNARLAERDAEYNSQLKIRERTRARMMATGAQNALTVPETAPEDEDAQ